MMNDPNTILDQFLPASHPVGAGIFLPPTRFIELLQLRATSIEHRLGYFRSAPYVIFGYCPGGGEVIWKDGQSSGFGTGGWRTFLHDIAPLAARYGAFLGDLTRAGTHVLFMDRSNGKVYAASRKSAESALVRLYGLPPTSRKCMCSLLDCDACPLRFACRSK